MAKQTLYRSVVHIESGAIHDNRLFSSIGDCADRGMFLLNEAGREAGWMEKFENLKTSYNRDARCLYFRVKCLGEQQIGFDVVEMDVF